MRKLSPAPPDETSLREAALAHLARYAATQAGLRRVLDRRVDRWVRAQPTPVEPAVTAEARRVVRTVVTRLAAAGAVDDVAFAAARAARLGRSGHSRRAIAAHLAARGVAAEIAAEAIASDDAAELTAALKLAQRRRIGPFRPTPADEAARLRELGMLARAGFPQEVARRALAMDQDAAEHVLHQTRQEHA